MSCGIYKIESLIDHKVYIGQSIDIEARWAAHCYAARGNKDQYPLHVAMRTQGVENFSYEIIETCAREELDEKEIAWIEYYDSYRNGYNGTPGGSQVQGENNPRALLTEAMVYEIRQMYNHQIPFRDAYAQYADKISKRGFQKVWRLETWKYVCPEVYTDENRRWHATAAKAHIDGNTSYGVNNTERACSEEEIQQMRELREQGLTYAKISQITGRAPSTVRKACLQTVRKPQFGFQIRNIETGIVFNSLAEASRWAHCNHQTFTAHKDDPSWPVGLVPTTNQPAHWEWL